MAGPLLALLVDAHLAQGDLEGAERAARRLELVARAQRGPYPKAAAALAMAGVTAPAEFFSEQNVGRILARP